MSVPQLDSVCGHVGSSITPPRWHLRQAYVPAVWLHTRGAGTTIAVVDDWVDPRHPEFDQRIVGPSEPSIEVDKYAVQRRCHGTKVAGIACAGGIEVIGVAPEAHLLPVEVDGLPEEVATPGEASAIDRAVAQGADILCCAWGAPLKEAAVAAMPLATMEALGRAVQKGRGGKGCVVVFAAGNDGTSVDRNPYASYEAAVTVGACDSNDRHPPYSNSGDAIWCVFPSTDHASPAVEIPTTAPVGSKRLGETWYVESFGRTSAACAGVAGVCALILSANPDLHWWEVKGILRSTADTIDLENGKYDEDGHSLLYGYGRVNAGRAVEAALAAG